MNHSIRCTVLLVLYSKFVVCLCFCIGFNLSCLLSFWKHACCFIVFFWLATSTKIGAFLMVLHRSSDDTFTLLQCGSAIQFVTLWQLSRLYHANWVKLISSFTLLCKRKCYLLINWDMVITCVALFYSQNFNDEHVQFYRVNAACTHHRSDVSNSVLWPISRCGRSSTLFVQRVDVYTSNKVFINLFAVN